MVRDKMEKAREMMDKAMTTKPEDVPLLYCASGIATCKDIDTSQMCICGDCPLWEEYNLPSLKPMGYYCRDGAAME